MTNSTKIRYFTKDTVLASWLHMNGIDCEGVTDNESAQMIFSGLQTDINTLVEEFQNGNPHGNVITFFRSYKFMLALIKERKLSKKIEEF